MASETSLGLLRSWDQSRTFGRPALVVPLEDALDHWLGVALVHVVRAVDEVELLGIRRASWVAAELVQIAVSVLHGHSPIFGTVNDEPMT